MTAPHRPTGRRFLLYCWLAMCCAWLATLPAWAAEGVPIDDRVSVTFSGLRLNRTTHTFDTVARLTSTSTTAILSPVTLVITHISSTAVSVANATGTTAEGAPFLAIPLAGDTLAPGATVNNIVVKFTNPTRVPFTFSYAVRGRLPMPRLSPVPAVVGLPQAEAEAAIVAAGLAVGTISTAESVTVPAGAVISQAPTAGTQVAAGTAVDLVVSLGPAPVLVPDVVGHEQTAAEMMIMDVGLAVGVVTTAHSPTVPAEHVISQSPVAGTPVPPGSAVDLVVSLGPALVSVPDVVGQEQTDAVSTLGMAGLAVGNITTAHSPTVPAGHVISQFPVAGTSVAIGSPVDLVVSLGMADTSPPVVTITAPSDESVVNSSPVTVSGTVDDPTATVEVNGVVAVTSNGTFTAQIPLAEGSNTITATAADLAGNPGTASIQVTLFTPLAITLTSPSNGQLTNATTVQVHGTVDSQADTVTVNGVAAALSSTTFTATVPLREGNNTLTAVARNAGGRVGTASVTIIRDTTPPSVVIELPVAGQIVTTPTVAVAGMVNDIVTGTVNQVNCQVLLSGPAGTHTATVHNRTFLVPDFPLLPGPNLLTAIATDTAGNTSMPVQVEVTRQTPQGAQLQIVSGNHQSGVIRTPLADPLVVQALDAAGNPMAGQAVRFRVTRNNGLLHTANAPDGQSDMTVVTDAAGQAAVGWTLGNRVGACNNRVEVSAAGIALPVLFCASATPAPCDKLLTISGDNQVGSVGAALARPFEVVAVDPGGNVCPDLPVTFEVEAGAGNFAGSPSVTVTTNSDGRATAVLTLGPLAGVNSNVVLASFPALPSLPARFRASAVIQGPEAATRFVGIVLDTNDQALPNVTVGIEHTAPPIQTITDASGQFVLSNVPPGSGVLLVDGATTTRPGRWPTIDLQITVIAGVDNSLGRPIHLPELDSQGFRAVGSVDTVLEMAGVEGFALKIFAHSATFHDGSTSGFMGITQVSNDQAPMPPIGGAAPPWVLTLQPPGVILNPPAQLTVPNAEGLPAGQIVDLFSFDHDLQQFVSVGTGTVQPDGATIVSDPGSGLGKSGWGYVFTPPPRPGRVKVRCKGGPCPPPPPPPPPCPSCGTCDDDDPCNGVLGCRQISMCTITCFPVSPPLPNGEMCNDRNPVTIYDQCVNQRCTGVPGVCLGLPCGDNNICNGTETCDQVLGCQAGTPLPDGTPCNDGNPQSMNDQCRTVNGIHFCRGTTPPQSCATNNDCDDNNACNGQEFCDVATRTCQQGIPLPVGSSCGPCSIGGACDGNGACTGGMPVQIAGVEAKADGLNQSITLVNRDIHFTVTVGQTNCPVHDLHYEWDFGDGTTSTEQSPTHSYTQEGQEFTAKVTVSCGLCIQQQETAIVTIAVPVVEITRIWSTQFPGILANFLPNGAGQVGNLSNVLLMGPRFDILNGPVASVRVHFDVIPNRSYLEDRMLMRFQNSVGELKGTSSRNGRLIDLETLTLDVITTQPYTVEYQIVAGVDLDGDGNIAPDEALPTTRPGVVRVVTPLTYTAIVNLALIGAVSSITDLDLIFLRLRNLPIARQFLFGFLLDTPLSGAMDIPDEITMNDPSLSHNVGVLFNAQGRGPIRHNIFPPDSEIAQKIRDSLAFGAALFSTVDCRDPREIQAPFLNDPTLQEYKFEWPIITQGRNRGCQGITVVFSASDGALDEDLGKSIHGANLNNAILEATYKRDSSKVVLIDNHIKGSLGPDLYDWEQLGLKLDEALAAVQAGYNTLGNAGHIFRVTVQLDGKRDAALLHEVPLP